MTTYTVPISEGIARKLASLPAEKVNAVNAEIAELIADFLEEQGPLDPTDYPLTDDDIASIRRGLEDSEAGRVTDGDTFFAHLFERVGLPAPDRQNG